MQQPVSHNPRPRPPLNCPKCGYDYGFLYPDPKYEPADGYHLERLRFACSSCGFVVYTATADQDE